MDMAFLPLLPELQAGMATLIQPQSKTTKVAHSIDRVANPLTTI